MTPLDIDNILLNENAYFYKKKKVELPKTIFKNYS